MKNLQHWALNFNNSLLLTRAEMKNVTGGNEEEVDELNPDLGSCYGWYGDMTCRERNSCYTCSNTYGIVGGTCKFDKSRCNTA